MPGDFGNLGGTLLQVQHQQQPQGLAACLAAEINGLGQHPDRFLGSVKTLGGFAADLIQLPPRFPLQQANAPQLILTGPRIDAGDHGIEPIVDSVHGTLHQFPGPALNRLDSFHQHLFGEKMTLPAGISLDASTRRLRRVLQ